MELASEEPRMSLELHYLDQAIVGRYSGRDQAHLFKLGAVAVVDFPSMAMALGDARLAIECERQRPLLDRAGPCAQAHGAALLRDLLLRLHDVDDGVGRVGRYLGRVRALEPEQIARGLDHHHVQSEA